MQISTKTPVAAPASPVLAKTAQTASPVGPSPTLQGPARPGPAAAPTSAFVAARHVPVELTPRAPVVSLASLAEASAAAKPTKMTTVFEDEFCKIVSDDSTMTRAQGQALAKKVEDAWQADLNLEQWTDTSPLTRNKLTVEALTKAGFDKELGGDSTGVAGVTMGPNLMAVPENLASSTNPDDDDTIAHELSHVMDFRAAGRGIDSIPVYEQEGRAYVIGDTYPITQGTDKSDPVLGKVGALLASITGKQAADVMKNYRDGSAEADPSRNGFRDETTGALYVQFLKTRLGGQGVPDALQRLAQVSLDVGKGLSYDKAFQKGFGVTSKSTEDAFVKYVTDTEGKPAERMSGTLWAPYMDLSSKGAARAA